MTFLSVTKRRVEYLHGHFHTCLETDMTSETCPLAIEGVKDRYGQANPACRLVKLEGVNVGKGKGEAEREVRTKVQLDQPNMRRFPIWQGRSVPGVRSTQQGRSAPPFGGYSGSMAALLRR